jgi:ferredoxin
MACASVCPAKALSAGGDTPRLDFHEANCVQCGLCSQACPESVISLQARLIHDPEQRRARRVLNEEAPFCCVSCGTPFATNKVIERMLDKLSGHWMYKDETARNRLKMCQDCRVIDMMKDSA